MNLENRNLLSNHFIEILFSVGLCKGGLIRHGNGRPEAGPDLNKMIRSMRDFAPLHPISRLSCDARYGALCTNITLCVKGPTTKI